MKIKSDLTSVFEKHFSNTDLIFLIESRSRLHPGKYVQGNNMCIFAALTALHSHPITNRKDLTRFFTGGCSQEHRERPEYQPARFLVRWFDGTSCSATSERYGRAVAMPTTHKIKLVVEVAQSVLHKRLQKNSTRANRAEVAAEQRQPKHTTTTVPTGAALQ